ncbi:MAG: hypothetical protein IPK39_12170 [Sulfuritalea sp.]|nr:hypothetical protein [Sulfuritalea sp.]
MAKHMNALKNDLPAPWWADNLENIDREIARLATLCQVRILQPGVIERVLRKDASVCGTSNEIAFAKLRDMIMLHFAVRQMSADVVGQTETAQIEDYVVERLKKSFPDLAVDWQQGEARKAHDS